jgi:hypothetical protein
LFGRHTGPPVRLTSRKPPYRGASEARRQSQPVVARRGMGQVELPLRCGESTTMIGAI